MKEASPHDSLIKKNRKAQEARACLEEVSVGIGQSEVQDWECWLAGGDSMLGEIASGPSPVSGLIPFWAFS